MIDDSTICTYQKELSQKNHVPGAPHSKVVYRSVEASRRCIGGCVKVSLHAIIRSNATMSRNGPADESGPEFARAWSVFRSDGALAEALAPALSV